MADGEVIHLTSDREEDALVYLEGIRLEVEFSLLSLVIGASNHPPSVGGDWERWGQMR